MSAHAVERIVLLTDSAAPSGVGAHMLTLGHGLATDTEVVIAAPAGTGLLEHAAARGLAIRRLPPDEPALAGWLGRWAPDLVHVHAGIGWEGHGAVRAAHAAGVPVIRTEHLPYLLTEPSQQADHAAMRHHLGRLICVSDGVAESHLAAGVDPALIATVPNGVTAPAPRRDRAALRAEWHLGQAPVLLMVGRFAAQKGHDLLLNALPAVLARHPDLVLLLAGDGPLLIPTAQGVAARGLAGHVRMLGVRDDVADLMEAADLLVLPSRFEGLPLALLEAMAAGLPAVATDAPGNRDAVVHGLTGWLASPDADGLAATIAHALDDPVRLGQTGERARDAHAIRFTAERMVRDTKAIYASVRAAPRDLRTRPMQRTRIGFIGAGGIANRHFGVLEQFGDVEVAAIADIDLARATEAAARVGARAFDDAAAMLDQVPLDALYICVPPFAHGDPERLAIRHRLPFFVEKPVALDLDVAEAVADEVAAAGLVTAVGYHWRYLDTVDQVKALLDATPARLLSGYWLDSTPPPRWWWRQDQSGGQMVEQTTHLIDLARYLVGEVTRVYGQAGHVERAEFPGLDVATTSTATLSFASGAIANFASTCLLGWNHRVGLHLFGEGLAVELTDHDVMIDTGAGRPVTANGSDPVWREDRDFIDAVQDKVNRVRCPYDEALATLRLSLAVAESARTGRAVDIAPVSAREAAHV